MEGSWWESHDISAGKGAGGGSGVAKVRTAMGVRRDPHVGARQPAVCPCCGQDYQMAAMGVGEGGGACRRRGAAQVGSLEASL